jgi:hypothetical protein
MKKFTMQEEGVGLVEYCVLRCPVCKYVFRHDLTVNAFGKPIKNRMCPICGEKVPVDDLHCLNDDPMRGDYKAEFRKAGEI